MKTLGGQKIAAEFKLGKQAWGQQHRYPANNFAQFYCDATKQATLTDSDVRLLESYGFVVREVASINGLQVRRTDV